MFKPSSQNNFSYKSLINPASPIDVGRVERLLSPELDGKRFLIGRNDISKKLASNIQVSGIVDDFYGKGSWNGISVIAKNQLPADSYLINCSSSISPVSVQETFEKIPHINVLGYHELAHCCPEHFPFPDFVVQTRENYEQNENQWLTLYDELEDEESKKVLFDLLRFRMSGDINYMQEYSVRLSDQYFEPFMNYKEEIFVDAGGFTGDTSEEMVKRHPDYQHIYLFEPSSVNIAAARIRLSMETGSGKVTFSEIGLSDKKETLSFDSQSGSASTITSSGSIKIKVDRLDKLVAGKVTFIKMDLEGWESSAISGAKEHIDRNHPKLAIAVYHKPEDFWKIKNQIFSIRSDYKLFLRHYTEGWSETVMYFLPT